MVYRQALRQAQRQLSPAQGLAGLIKKWWARRALRSANESRQWLKVLDLAEEVLTLHPIDEHATLALAAAFETLDLLDHAVWVLEQAPAKSGAIEFQLIRLYERTGRFSQAQRLKAPHEPASEAPRTSWQARHLAELDAFRQNVILAEHKLAADPQSKSIPPLLTRLRHEIQALEIDLCRHEAERHPNDMSRRLDLGALLLKAGQFEAAIDAVEAARADARLGWRATLYAAYCYLNLRQWRRAEPLFREALSRLPQEDQTTRQEVLRLLAENGHLQNG